eukprot:TRINITY_DN5681_c0_g1_i1.p1 TRINITY_DN5681_c0_g1~~TRINITY_DN5681_c0_g1_i1.p1  ORF type:complete len:663 (-),score=164.48 TRINITY_DN5681_c0_g1_i1:825-2813(-)
MEKELSALRTKLEAVERVQQAQDLKLTQHKQWTKEQIQKLSDDVKDAKQANNVHKAVLTGVVARVDRWSAVNNLDKLQKTVDDQTEKFSELEARLTQLKQDAAKSLETCEEKNENLSEIMEVQQNMNSIFEEKSSKLASDISTLFMNFDYLKAALDDFELWRQNNLCNNDNQNLSANPSMEDFTKPDENETKDAESDDLKDWENLKKFVDAKLKNSDAKAKKCAETESTPGVSKSSAAKCTTSQKEDDDKENKEPKSTAKATKESPKKPAINTAFRFCDIPDPDAATASSPFLFTSPTKSGSSLTPSAPEFVPRFGLSNVTQDTQHENYVKDTAKQLFAKEIARVGQKHESPEKTDEPKPPIVKSSRQRNRSGGNPITPSALGKFNSNTTSSASNFVPRFGPSNLTKDTQNHEDISAAERERLLDEKIKMMRAKNEAVNQRKREAERNKAIQAEMLQKRETEKDKKAAKEGGRSRQKKQSGSGVPLTPSAVEFIPHPSHSIPTPQVLSASPPMPYMLTSPLAGHIHVSMHSSVDSHFAGLPVVPPGDHQAALISHHHQLPVISSQQPAVMQSSHMMLNQPLPPHVVTRLGDVIPTASVVMDDHHHHGVVAPHLHHQHLNPHLPVSALAPPNLTVVPSHDHLPASVTAATAQNQPSAAISPSS